MWVYQADVGSMLNYSRILRSFMFHLELANGIYRFDHQTCSGRSAGLCGFALFISQKQMAAVAETIVGDRNEKEADRFLRLEDLDRYSIAAILNSPVLHLR